MRIARSLAAYWVASLLCAGCARVPATSSSLSYSGYSTSASTSAFARPVAAARAQRPAAPTIRSAIASSYVVRRGDTLWRIAQAFGVSAGTLAAANRVRSPSELKVGQRLIIPPPSPLGSSRFLWPTRGQISRGRRGIGSFNNPGLEIYATAGSFVRASRTGRVAVAANRLADLGRTVILDHGDGYLTVYSGMDALLVSPGLAVAQGAPVGRLGDDPLYFEVRYRRAARDPLKVLP